MIMIPTCTKLVYLLLSSLLIVSSTNGNGVYSKSSLSADLKSENSLSKVAEGKPAPNNSPMSTSTVS